MKSSQFSQQTRLPIVVVIFVQLAMISLRPTCVK